MRILLFITLIIVSCSPDPQEEISCPTPLPCFEVGQGDFLAVNINEEPWIADVGFSLDYHAQSASLSENGQIFYIHGHRINENENLSLDIVWKAPYPERFFNEIDTSIATRFWDFKNDPDCSHKYRPDPDFDHSLEIIEVCNEIAGNLKQYKGYFSARFVGECDTLTLSDGIFKIGYGGKRKEDYSCN